MKNDLTIVRIENLFKEFLESKKKTKVLDISKKYFTNKELSVIKAYFSKVLFDNMENAKLKDYKNYFDRAMTYEDEIKEFMDKVESEEYREYIHELSDLYLFLVKEEFLLKLNKFDILCLLDRNYTMYK